MQIDNTVQIAQNIAPFTVGKGWRLPTQNWPTMFLTPKYFLVRFTIINKLQNV